MVVFCVLLFVLLESTSDFKIYRRLAGSRRAYYTYYTYVLYMLYELYELCVLYEGPCVTLRAF